jgi:hypothetical protein
VHGAPLGVLASLGEQFGPEWVTGESGTVKIVSEMCSSDCCFTKISGMQVGTHDCNSIEAPWRVNGGHGASLRHHN